MYKTSPYEWMVLIQHKPVEKSTQTYAANETWKCIKWEIEYRSFELLIGGVWFVNQF